MKTNEDVKVALVRAGVKQKDLAHELGIFQSNLCYKLNHKMTQDEIQHYLELIKKIKKRIYG